MEETVLEMIRLKQSFCVGRTKGHRLLLAKCDYYPETKIPVDTPAATERFEILSEWKYRYLVKTAILA